MTSAKDALKEWDETENGCGIRDVNVSSLVSAETRDAIRRALELLEKHEQGWRMMPPSNKMTELKHRKTILQNKIMKLKDDLGIYKTWKRSEKKPLPKHIVQSPYFQDLNQALDEAALLETKIYREKQAMITAKED